MAWVSAFYAQKGHLFVRDDVGRTEKKTDKYSLFRQNTYLQNKKHTLTCQGGTGCYRFNYQPGS